MRQTRSSTLSWKKCLVRATGTSSWRFLGGTSVCMQRRATQHSTSFIPMPLLGGIISPTRGSYCFRDARSILLVSKRCWPQAQAPSWSFKTMFMPRHAEHLSRSVLPSCSSLLGHLQYSSTVTPQQGTITIDTIYPATEKHISKHSSQNFIMVSASLDIQ